VRLPAGGGLRARGGPIGLTTVADWTLLRDPRGRPGRDNMAIDAALLTAARNGRAFLRLYRWSPPCLSFGRNEAALRRYDRAAIERRGCDTVRRPTGGRAVWHEHELTYAVAAPVDHLGALREAYATIHAVIADALAHLGVETRPAGAPARVPGLGAGACFSTPVGGELVVPQGKLVGSAQRREGGALLQHGSVLLTNTQNLVAHLTRGPPGPAAQAASLADVLGRSVTFDEVADAVVAAARARWSGSWTEEESSTYLPETHTFGHTAWTWRR